MTAGRDARSLLRAALGAGRSLWVRLSNPALEAIARSPGDLASRLERAIGRGIAYFAGQSELEPVALVLLGRLLQQGHEPRLAFLRDRLDAYRRRCNDPTLRLLDRGYDPSAPDRLALELTEATDPMERLMVRCMYADRSGEGRRLLGELEALEDGGGYGTTHAAWGALLLREFGAATPAELEPVAARALRQMVRLQQRSLASDLFAERIVMLQWLGHPEAVSPVWMLRLARAQNDDGGWPRRIRWPREASSQHTSSLALLALVQYCHRPVRAGRDGMPRGSEAKPR